MSIEHFSFLIEERHLSGQDKCFGRATWGKEGLLGKKMIWQKDGESPVVRAVPVRDPGPWRRCLLLNWGGVAARTRLQGASKGKAMADPETCNRDLGPNG
ncbi:hypothetical protein SBV1_1900003 [Verrucomicrobia bacterium]|nr:hypothetical protein SBV1_1900003 [Verrucomicrobiota bacterium]